MERKHRGLAERIYERIATTSKKKMVKNIPRPQNETG